MVLQLSFNDFLRMHGAQGAAIEVLDGKVWITEDGRKGDAFVESGRSYRVAGEGLVVVGAEARTQFARVIVRRPERRLLGWLLTAIASYLDARRAELTRRELHALSDRMLNDIGLRRDDIDERFR